MGVTWTWWNIFVVTLISCVVVFLHNLALSHPPWPAPRPTFLESMGAWGGKVSQAPRGKYP